jgi:cation diffusion facilitator family transporter
MQEMLFAAGAVCAAVLSKGSANKVTAPACDGGDCCPPEPDPRAARAAMLRRGLRLEYLTVGWNIIEGLIAISAGVRAGSIALLAFGIDSFVECASGGVLIWRLSAEKSSTSPERIEQLEHSARRLVGASLFLLAAYVAFDAGKALLERERPDSSTVGIVLAAVSIAVMFWLAGAKRRTAALLGSSAMRADAAQTMACWQLSLATLGGVGLNALFGWWWADPVAALVIAALVVREGREAWQGRDCC